MASRGSRRRTSPKWDSVSISTTVPLGRNAQGSPRMRHHETQARLRWALEGCTKSLGSRVWASGLRFLPIRQRPFSVNVRIFCRIGTLPVRHRGCSDLRALGLLSSPAPYTRSSANARRPSPSAASVGGERIRAQLRYSLWSLRRHICEEGCKNGRIPVWRRLRPTSGTLVSLPDNMDTAENRVSTLPRCRLCG